MMKDYNDLFATFDQLGRDYDWLKEQASRMSNYILDAWEVSVQSGLPCPFCDVSVEPGKGDPHTEDCPVLSAIAVQELDPEGRAYI